MICPLLIASHIPKIFNYSSHFINRFGNYHMCSDDPQFNYYFLTLGIKNTAQQGLYYALCLPKQCTKTIVQNFLNEATKKQTVPIEIVSIQQTADFQRANQYNFKFWLTMLIILFLLMTVILSTLIKSLKNSPVLKHFSLRQNIEIFNYKEGSSSLNVLNGIKALAMSYVVFGHSESFLLGQIQNIISFPNQLKKPQALVVEAGIYAVDTFFFVGGMLLAYSFLRQTSENYVKYPLAIIHRVLRFWPCYFLTILIYSNLYPLIGSGPMWSAQIPQTKLCDKLWKPLFFIDNFVDNGETMCLGWGWYLQNDMQLFIYCMFLLLILSFNQIAFQIVLWLSIIGSNVYTFVEAQIHGYRSMATPQGAATFNMQFMTNIYIKPWARASPYLLGLFYGVLYVNFINQEKKGSNNSVFSRIKTILCRNRILRICIELFGILLIAFVVFIPRTEQIGYVWPQVISSFYITFAKSLFTIGIAFIILPSILGLKTFITFSLDTVFFSFVAKISFCVYMVHCLVISFFYGEKDIDYYYSIWINVPIYICHMVISIFFGFIMCIVVEIPFSKIQKKGISKLMNFWQAKPAKQSKHSVEQNLQKSIEQPLIINKQSAQTIDEK